MHNGGRPYSAANLPAMLRRRYPGGHLIDLIREVRRLPFDEQHPFDLEQSCFVRPKQVGKVRLVNQLYRIQSGVLLCLCIKELICDADLFERDVRVPAPVKRFTSDNFFYGVPTEFRAISSTGLRLNKLTSFSIDSYNVDTVIIRARRPIAIESTLTPECADKTLEMLPSHTKRHIKSNAFIQVARL